MTAIALTTENRARLSRGTSSDAIYRLVRTIIQQYSLAGTKTLYDVGAGSGAFRLYALDLCSRYIAIDAARYSDAIPAADFIQADLNLPDWSVEPGMADIAVAIETIEHLENPRALFRQLRRLTRPGGLIVVTTPNQLSLLSKMTLVVKNQFNAFQEKPGQYPTHITALLEADLMHICEEIGLVECRIFYSDSGRLPGTSMHWPKGFVGRWFSDNLAISARILL